ncbi:MAG: hypothetical protein CVU84_02035 [Firmicutes bacterium HGW-Firmicutes-1]|jgi:RecG-like helicase|nr:MAG: hypothetical protein CVU84_02035 [Firmicutes bacterium HGW-Firmicutes-1]
MKKIMIVMLLSALMTGCKQDVEKVTELNNIIETQNKTINEQKNSIVDLQSRLKNAKKRISEFETITNKEKINETPKSISDYYIATNDVAEKFIKAYVENDIDTMKQYVAEYISINQEEIIIDLKDLEMYGLPPKEVKTIQVPFSSEGDKYVFERFVYDEINSIQYYEYGLIYDEKYGIEGDLRLRINAQGVVTYFEVLERGI